jgi:hypothetical protein
MCHVPDAEEWHEQSYDAESHCGFARTREVKAGLRPRRDWNVCRRGGAERHAVGKAATRQARQTEASVPRQAGEPIAAIVSIKSQRGFRENCNGADRKVMPAVITQGVASLANCTRLSVKKGPEDATRRASVRFYTRLR